MSDDKLYPGPPDTARVGYPLHENTFGYLKPSDAQMECMERLRVAAKVYADILEDELPSGPDRTYLLRKLREVAMWANVTVTRLTDGTPRR